MLDISFVEIEKVFGGACSNSYTLESGKSLACAPTLGRRGRVSVNSGSADIYCVGEAGPIMIPNNGGQTLCGIDQSVTVKATPTCRLTLSEVS